MKSFHALMALCLLPTRFLLAQTGSATKPLSATTTSVQSTTASQPAVQPIVTRAAVADTATARKGTRTNRRQELYDQYHSVTKRPASSSAATTTTASATPAPSRPVNRPATQPTTTQPVERPEKPALPASVITSTSTVRIGLRGGVTYPVYLEDQGGINPVLGFTGGVVLNVGTGAVSFQPEINYTRYAFKSTIDFVGAPLRSAIDVIEVPLLVKFSSGSYRGNRFFLNVGPYGSYASSASTNGQKQPLDGGSRFQFGAAAGIGAALKAGLGHVTIEVRGLYGLGNNNVGFTTNAKTLFTQATLGYIVPLGGR